MKLCRLLVFVSAAALAVASLLPAGCDVSAPNSVERNVGVDYTGIYDGTANSNGMIATQNSGEPITRFNLRQTGASLQAVDNNGEMWNGSINNSPDSQNLTANFIMNGKTTWARKSK